MQHLKIDIVSDIACPWCAIGYARLEQAMKQMAQDAAFSIQWHAFELNPEHGSEGEPILPALARKYGRSEDEMRAAQSDMTRIATELGLNFEKMQQRFTCNTFDAHRLVKWAEGQGKATEMKLALFEAYFGRADDVFKDIADRFSEMEDGSAKTALAVEIFGRAGAKLIPLLNSGSSGLSDMASEARRLGISFGEDAAKAAEEFNDNLTRLGKPLQGIGNLI
ncbi:MAG: hypothetical protein B7X58_08110, partial [Marinobacter sp. 34-60-7]